MRLGASTGAIAHLLPQALETLARDHPRIDVQVAVLTSQETLLRLADGTLDLGWWRCPSRPWTAAAAVAARSGAGLPARVLAGAGPHARLAGRAPADPERCQHAAVAPDRRMVRRRRPEPARAHPAQLQRRHQEPGGGRLALLPHEATAPQPDPRIAMRPLRPALWRPLGIAHRAGDIELATRHVLDVLWARAPPRLRHKLMTARYGGVLNFAPRPRPAAREEKVVLHSSAGWHRSPRRPWARAPAKDLWRAGRADRPVLHRMGRPPRAGRSQSLVHRADGRVRRAAVRRARQPAGPALVHHGRQSGVRADRRGLRPCHCGSGPGRGGGRLAGHRRHVHAALPASAQRRGGADRRPGRPGRGQPGLRLRAVAGGAELRDPAVHRRGLQRRAAPQLSAPPRRAGRLASDARPAPSARLGFPAPTWTRR